MKLIYKLERKIGNWAIPNLMLMIVIGMGIVFVADMFVDGGIIQYLTLTPSLILQGQVWRLLTFIFVPVSTSVLFVLLTLYFYYFIGNSLELQWGSFRFGAFYFISIFAAIVGAFALYFILGAINPFAAAIVTISNNWLNLALFIAFAILFPELQVRLFFFIPIKVKWLAILDAVLFCVYLVIGDWSTRVGILAALVNLAIFFGGEAVRKIKNWLAFRKTRRNFKQQMNQSRFRDDYYNNNDHDNYN